MKENFAVFAFVLTWLTHFPVCEADPACDKWNDMSKDMTGNGEHQTCVRGRNPVCTRIDCEGNYMENILPKMFNIDYCFGVQLNSCYSPLSMDFYLNLPHYNYTHQLRITHDKVVSLSDVNIPLLKIMKVEPILDFEFRRNSTRTLLVSVTLKVRSPFVPIFFDEYERTVIKEQTIPMQDCPKGVKTDLAKQPDADFHAAACHDKKYPSTNTKIITPVDDHIKPSATFNKTCDFKKTCSLGETCEMTSDTDGICQCEADYHYVIDKEACVSRGNVGKVCLYNADCGLYEICGGGKGGTSSNLKCLCEESYLWDGSRNLCILNQHHRTPPSVPKHTDHTMSPEGTDTTAVPDTTAVSDTTQSPGQPKAHQSKHNKSSGSNTKYLIIGITAAGVAVIVAVTIGGILLCRRRKRNNLIAGGGLYDSHGPMLADTDDDVDLVM